MSDDTTVVFTDINEALASAEKEALHRPAAFLAVGGELNGTIFNLDQGETTFGRSAENTVPLEFSGISRMHLKVQIQGDKAYIEDMGSRNGTYVNNQKVESKTLLQKQDIVKIGSIALKYIPKGDPERLAYDKLNHEANTDKLTGCYNKGYFNTACDIEVKKSKVTGHPLSLVVMDIDFFKKLNDTYGHDAGDHVLREISKMIRAAGVRDQDIFARYGGEEFVILLPRTNIKQAFEISERVRKLVESAKFTYEDRNLPVTISIGIADYRQGIENGVDLFKRADKALYQSKQNGRNQVSFFKV